MKVIAALAVMLLLAGCAAGTSQTPNHDKVRACTDPMTKHECRIGTGNGGTNNGGDDNGDDE